MWQKNNFELQKEINTASKIEKTLVLFSKHFRVFCDFINGSELTTVFLVSSY